MALRELDEKEEQLTEKPIMKAYQNAHENNTTVTDELENNGLRGFGFDQ